MKKLILIIMAFFMIAPAISSKVLADDDYELRPNGGNGVYYYKTADVFSGGSGTEEDPYLISSWEEFNLINSYGCGDEGVGVCFKVIADLDSKERNAAYIYNSAIGSKEKPFQGTFDGENHNVDSSNSYIFDVVGKNGVVRNIKSTEIGIAAVNDGLIEKCSIETRRQQIMATNAGGIAGENTGTIRQCIVRGISPKVGARNIVCTSTGIGGICGFNKGGIIEECYADASLYGKGSSARAVGGIAGDNTGGVIRNCISKNYIVNDGSESGGVAGRLYNGKIENCIAMCSFSGLYKYTGAIAGALYENSEIIDSYFSGLMVGNSTEDNAEYGFSDWELKKNPSLYKDWDFENVWCIGGEGYPSFRYFYTFPDCINHWACDKIEAFYQNGIVVGYEDGNFHPDDKVTKAEFIKMVVETGNLHGTIGINSPHEYTDIPEWAEPYVQKAYNLKLLENIAYNDNLLGADEPITRLEAGVIAGRTAKQHTDIGVRGVELNFTDIDKIPQWAIKPLEWAQGADVHGYIAGYEDGSFRPDNTLTRAEAVAMVFLMK